MSRFEGRANVSQSTQHILPQIEFALAQSRVWTAPLVSPWFFSSRDPVRAADAFLKRQTAAGLLGTLVADTVVAALPSQPLASSADFVLNVDALAYELHQRWTQPSARVRIFWPSAAFARRYGRWTGSNQEPCFHKIGHDLLVSAVTVSHLLDGSENEFADTWISEQKLQFEARRGRWSGPLPDALMVSEHGTTAVEIGGHYPSDWLRHHVRRFERTGWDWVIW